MTNQRMLALEIMAERPGQHLTAEEIYDLARQKCPETGLAAIYRTMQLFVDLSIMDKVSFDDGFARYELGGFEGDRSRGKALWLLQGMQESNGRAERKIKWR